MMAKNTNPLLKMIKKLIQNFYAYLRNKEKQRKKKTHPTRQFPDSISKNQQLRTPSTSESAKRHELVSFRTKPQKFSTKKILNNYGIYSKKTFLFLKTEPKESIMISLSMFHPCCRLNAGSFSQVLLSLNLKEMSMGEQKLCRFSIMLFERSTCFRLESRSHFMIQLVMDILRRKILKITYLNLCLHFLSYRICRKISTHFM